MLRRLLVLFLLGFLSAALPAQEEVPPADDESREEAATDLLPLPPEPTSPREELFLAIELKDVEAAHRALRSGAEAEISVGDPSPLGTAALHDDMAMVVLLLDFGGDPAATGDSPLEEAIRNENAEMVRLFMQAGARVPEGDRGRELFRLAQRGGAARELSAVLLDHDANPDLCLAAAVERARVASIAYCLDRGGDVGALPEGLNVLAVALESGDARLVDRVVAEGLADRVIAGALREAIEAGHTDLVRRAVRAGAVPAFRHVEAAIESGHPAIALFLLDQSPPDDPSVFAGGDATELVQRAHDLGFEDLSTALRRKSGVGAWSFQKVMPVVLAGLAVLALVALAARSLSRSKQAAASVATPEPWRREPPRPAGRPAPGVAPQAPREPPAAPQPPPAVEPAAPQPSGPEPPSPAFQPPAPAAPGSTKPASEPPPAPSPAPPPSPPEAAFETVVLPSEAPEPPAAPPPAAPPAPAAVPSPASSPAAPAPDLPAPAEEAWEIVAEPAVEPEPAGAAPALEVSREVAPGFEPRMPEVDLGRAAEAVFESARRAAAGEAVRPDAPDRRQIVLVTPARVTMLRSCPAPGSVSPDDLLAAERIVSSAEARNVAAIAFNDLDAMADDVGKAIPFFDLLKHLGYLGHAVWIFEGHVSAMAAGCKDADVLIVDDGMMPYLPGNWRSVASRVMRGGEIFVFERKTGALRQL